MKSKICNINPIQPIIINEKYGTNKNKISLTDIILDDQIEEIEQNCNNFNLDTLKYSMMTFLLHYYGKLNFSRKDALQLQQDITKMIMCPIAQQIKNILSINETIDNNTKKSLELIINFLNNPFEDFESEYKFLKYLTNNDYYDKPKIICLDNTVDNIVHHNTNMIAEKKTKCVILPLKFQLRKYFGAPGILDSFVQHHNFLNSQTNYTNFLNSDLWKEKMLNFNKDDSFYIPYFLYFDDFEVNNPLGSHASPILGVYYCFPTAPSYLKSNLQSIFVAALFNSKDVKNLGNDRSFYHLIEELNELQNIGLTIIISGKNVKIKFVLGLVVGDNLGVNTVLGFTKSFSSNFFCRFCLSHKNHTQTLAIEDIDLLRNRQNYNEHVLKNDCKSTGVNEESIFNNIDSFHVVDNYAVDIMHDLFEGICVYNMCHIINSLISLGYFNLELLNRRKQGFDYGDTEIGNMSPPLMKNKLDKLKIKMSSREMQTFVHFFPLLVGDLVPECDSVWLFLVNFIELIDLLLLPSFSEQTILKLQSCILYHNSKYTDIFKDTLKPKHHLLIHYCNIIRKSGPLKYLWSYRFESKHRELKTYTKNITSRVQIPVSLAIKYSINFADFILNFNDNNLWTPVSTSSLVTQCLYFQHIKLLFLPNDLTLLNNAVCYDKITYCNTVYNAEHILTCYVGNNMLVYRLKKIICIDEKVLFFCESLNVLSYKKHIVSYIISRTVTSNYILKNIDDFIGPPINLCNLPTNETVIRLKHFY